MREKERKRKRGRERDEKAREERERETEGERGEVSYRGREGRHYSVPTSPSDSHGEQTAII